MSDARLHERNDSSGAPSAAHPDAAHSAHAATAARGHDPHAAREFDGILEENNPLPAWWVHLFWGSIAFSAAYLAWYHLPLFPSRTQIQELEAALGTGAPSAETAAAAGRASGGSGGSDAGLTAASLVADAASVDRGKALFSTNCASCHGADGGGIIGPNLADTAWMHGRTAPALVKVIAEGVPAKGMPAWGTILGAAKVKDVSAFVASLQGTKPASPKGPQGEEGALE